MRIHHLQHVHFEGLGSIASFLNANGHMMSSTHLYNNDPLPHINDFDALIIMGGPMGVSDEQEFPYLSDEKKLIGKAIESGKIVMGICLGAQLIADVLGAGVTKNTHREIG
jgi:GMP synthase-like glutamine amidotransferase